MDHGKSTLIKIILGKDSKYQGEIKLSPSVKIGYIPQEIKFENEKETIFEFFSKEYNKSQTEIRTFLAKYMFFGNNVFKRLEELSGGERVRLLLAKLVIKETNFLILDEPTNHLDIKYQLQIMDIVKSLNLTVIAAIHDLNIAAMYCDRLVALKDGQIVGAGKPKDLLTEKFIKDLYEVDTKIEALPNDNINIRFLPKHFK